jgi:hypothetical protein
LDSISHRRSFIWQFSSDIAARIGHFVRIPVAAMQLGVLV